ncbi:HAUS augmin-like complex subunit 1 [Amphiura filiformis]|uniref:HAUS augmin-like complex subunit 1 n=1 Tax=Amphiura filiformis TaxID=82378 RepID=UPI003B20BD37
MEEEQVSHRHREVRAWLEKVFGGADIPQYEINEHTIDILYGLMQRNQERDRDTQIIIDDFNQKAEEYHAEAVRLSSILQSVGLSPASLSQSGNVSLRTLSNTALTLGIKDATTSSYLLQMSELAKSDMETEQARHSEQRLSEQLFTKTKAALIKCNSLKKALSALEDQVEFQQPQLEKKTKESGFLLSKSKQYKNNLKQLQNQLQQNGFEANTTHQSLLKLAEELEELNGRLAPLKSKLDSYHNLPPDLALAKTKIAEANLQLAKLEAELAKSIDMMHM